MQDLQQKVRELEKKVHIAEQTLKQYAIIKQKHKEALAFLNKQKQFTTSIVESNQNAIIAINKKRRVIVFNASAEKIFGYTKKEMLNKDSLHKIIPDKFKEAHIKAVKNFIETKNSISITNNKIELEGLKKDGTVFPVRISFGVDFKENDIIIVANIDDISIERKQQQTIQQQNKMASMGEMIGAIAHQWRQPLNIISTSIQNLKYDFKERKLEDEAYVNEFIKTNKQTIKFMSKTIDDFRNFFRVDKEKIDFPILEITKAVINMQSAQLKNHNIKINIIGDEFIYYGYKSEYQQVILNLLNNAKDALIENVVLNPTIDIKIYNNIVTIQDNAGGIPQNILDRVFEPYFTTKEQGKGTGMGLYMSKMIIEENMGAKLKVENMLEGACFCIDFGV